MSKIKNNFDQKQFFIAIDLIAKNNLIEKSEILTIIEETIKRTFYSKYDPDAKLELVIDLDTSVFKLINHSVLIVDDQDFDPKNQTIEINLTQALKENPKAKVGQFMACEVNFNQFANQLKQLLTQTFRERKKQNIFEKNKDLLGTLIEAEVISITKYGDVILTINGNTSAFMPRNLRNHKIPLSIGQEVKVFVEEVKRESRDSQIIVSNGSRAIVEQVLNQEVPEIAQGLIEIKALARIAGERSKVAVHSLDPNIDPVGAIIGAEGRRINAIINKLEGEKIDIINWSSDLNRFIANALEPAKIIAIIDKRDAEDNVIKNGKIAITPVIHQTLAIGKNGSNVRLAVELTKTNIDIISLDQAQKDNISFEWNGTIEENNLNKIQRNQRSFNNNQKSPRNFGINYEEINEDIRSFQASLEEEPDSRNDQFEPSLKSSFTDEELKKLEAEFEQDFNLDFTNEEK